MDKGLEALKDLKGGAIVSALGLTEGQVKQLAEKLGVKPEVVKDKTFKQIGEMAQAKIEKDAAIKLQSLARGNQARKAVNKSKEELKTQLNTAMGTGLEGLKSLEGGAIVSALGLGENQVKQLAGMLGKAEAEIEQIKGKTFKEIGQMAQAEINLAGFNKNFPKEKVTKTKYGAEDTVEES